MGAPVTILDRQGREYTVDPSELESALGQGFSLPGEPRPLDPEEVQREADPFGAAAFGLGAARTATLGASDLGLMQTPGAALTEGAWKASPTASALGELAGMAIAPISKAGAALRTGIGATTLAGKVGASALTGGLEGLLFGADQAVDEKWLGEADLNAQKLIASAGLGAVLGAAGGGLGELVGEGGRALKARLAQFAEDTPGALDKFAAGRALKAAGFLKSDIRKLGTEEAESLGREMNARGYMRPGGTAEDVLAHAQAELETHGKGMQGILGAVDEQSGGKSFDMAKARQRIAEELGDQVRGNPVKEGWLQDALKGARLDEVGDHSYFTTANDIKTTLNEGLYGMAEAKGKAKLARQIGGILNDEIETQLKDAAGPEGLEAFLEAKRGYGVAKKVADVAERQGVAGMMGNRKFGLSSNVIGAAVGATHGFVPGVASAVLNKAALERGPSTLAWLASQIGKSPALSVVAEHFAQALKTPGAMEALGAYGPVLAQAVALSPEHGLAEHMTLARTDPKYRDAAALAGFGSRFQEPAGTGGITGLAKAQSMVGLQRALGAHDAATSERVGNVLTGGAKRTTPSIKNQDFGSRQMRRNSEAAYEQRAKDVQALASDPKALADRVSANIGPWAHHAPGTAAALTSAASRAASFLAQKSSHPPAGPLAPKWVAGPGERGKFSKYVEAVQDPMTVLRQAAAGHVSPEALEAVRAVYPQLYGSLQQSLLEAVTAHEGGVPYRQRVVLGLLTDNNLDGSMSPLAFTLSQSVYNAPSAKSGEDQPVGPTQRGAEKLTLAERSKTPQTAAATRE